MKTPWLVFATAALAAAPASANVNPGGDKEKLGEVFFEFDSARVEGATATIENIANWAADHPGMKIVIDGFADPQGWSPYNVGLALRRADGVRARLIASGIDADRIVIVTYGEDGARRASYQLDRRVTAWGTSEPLYAIIDWSLKTGTAVLWNRPVEATALVAPRPGPVATRLKRR